MIYNDIASLIKYALKTGLIKKEDEIYSVNRLLGILKLDGYEEGTADDRPLNEILDSICDYAYENGITEENSVVYRDLFDTEIMGAVTPRPSELIAEFNRLYAEDKRAATDFFYDFSMNTNYIRRDRIAKDMKWTVPTEYGELDITINLSKPEKDPKAIAAAKLAKPSGYPKCLLCYENEGYSGRVNHPARQNHRIIPVTINGEEWGLQYSPYVYYNEHCILFNKAHVPMKIDRAAFDKLFDFIRLFPHYIIGSNADLPIVGGSILAHEHFQGGNYSFPMANAPIEHELTIKGYEDVSAGIVKWPMSVIRISSENPARLSELAEKTLESWRGYTDEDAFIFAETDGEPHNTITPIARMRDGRYELDLVLRNNITTDEHPLGVYHPHAELHHIKKENIGLIEVMGVAILPARLRDERALLAEKLVSGGTEAVRADETLEKHADWAEEFSARRNVTKENADEVIRQEIGKVFEQVLLDAGVFKRTEDGMNAFLKFTAQIV